MAPETDLISAKWVAGFPARLPSGLELIPGETVVEVPRQEAEDSDNWEPQGSTRRQRTAPEPPAPEETSTTEDDD